MKKYLFVFMLTIAVISGGCSKNETNPTQTTPVTEITDTGNNAEDDASEEDFSADKYMASIKEESDSIKNFLEKEAMTQLDMNMSSQELYKLWDSALNRLWDELKATLPEAEFERLLDEQRAWIEEKEMSVEEAGKEVEGGSIYPLIVNSTAAEITEKRVYELYDILNNL